MTNPERLWVVSVREKYGADGEPSDSEPLSVSQRTVEKVTGIAPAPTSSRWKSGSHRRRGRHERHHHRRRRQPNPRNPPGHPMPITRAYLRVSTIDQANHGTSLDGQREEIARHVGSGDVVFYVDAESGSGGGEDRVEQTRLMADLKAGETVVVCKQDRWSRDTIHFLTSVRAIRQRGAHFVSLAERFDFATPEGEMAATMVAGMAQHERARIRERTHGAKQRLRAQGLWVDGATPLGYRIKARKPVIVESEAVVVRRMFQLAAEGRSGAQIGPIIAAEYPGTPGLDRGNLMRRLHDRRYLGETPTVKTARAGRRYGNWSGWVKTHEAIVDQATWDAVQSGLEKRIRTGRIPTMEASSARYLLRSLVRCEHCGHIVGCRGSLVEVVGARDYYNCKWCSLFARRDVADERIEREAERHLERLAARLASEPEKAAKPKADTASARARLVAKRVRLVTAVADGVFSLAEVRAAKEAIERELAAIEQKEAAAAAEAAPVSRAESLARIEEIRALWAAGTIPERREIVRILTEQVTLRRKKEAKKWERGAVEIVAKWKKSA